MPLAGMCFFVFDNGMKFIVIIGTGMIDDVVEK